MKPKMTGLILVCLFTALLSGKSLAIVVRGDAPNEGIMVDDADYPEVVALLDGRAVGTLIGEAWVITAAHVGQFVDQAPDGRRISIAGEPNEVTEVVIHPSWAQEELGAPDVIDIALLRLARAVSKVSPVPLYKEQSELNSIVTLFGWGRTGDGENESLIRDGRFRRGENRVDAVTPRLQFRFDEPGSDRALPLEAVSGPGDSGGPAFIETDGVRYLAGVSSFQKDITAPGIFGVTENYERVSDHIDWITSVIQN